MVLGLLFRFQNSKAVQAVRHGARARPATVQEAPPPPYQESVPPGEAVLAERVRVEDVEMGSVERDSVGVAK